MLSGAGKLFCAGIDIGDLSKDLLEMEGDPARKAFQLRTLIAHLQVECVAINPAANNSRTASRLLSYAPSLVSVVAFCEGLNMIFIAIFLFSVIYYIFFCVLLN